MTEPAVDRVHTLFEGRQKGNLSIEAFRAAIQEFSVTELNELVDLIRLAMLKSAPSLSR
jgi:hypothetical protein